MYARIDDAPIHPSYLEVLGDAELIRMVRSGSDDALGILLRRHRDALYRFCMHMTPNRDDAEDVCQETMARAITRVGTLQTGGAFRSWLFSIARNLSIDSYRARKRICALPDENISVLPPPLMDESPYDRLEAAEECQTVSHALRKLAKSHQTILMLREVEGLSYTEISERLGLSQSAVESLLFRARRRLRDEYSRTASPVRGLAVFGGLRGLLARVSLPFGSASAPVAAKIGVSALILATVATVAAPRLPALVHPASAPSRIHATRHFTAAHVASVAAPATAFPPAKVSDPRLALPGEKHSGASAAAAHRARRTGVHGAKQSSGRRGTRSHTASRPGSLGTSGAGRSVSTTHTGATGRLPTSGAALSSAASAPPATASSRVPVTGSSPNKSTGNVVLSPQRNTSGVPGATSSGSSGSATRPGRASPPVQAPTSQASTSVQGAVNQASQPVQSTTSGVQKVVGGVTSPVPTAGVPSASVPPPPMNTGGEVATAGAATHNPVQQAPGQVGSAGSTVQKAEPPKPALPLPGAKTQPSAPIAAPLPVSPLP